MANRLHIFEQNLLTTAVVELCRPAVSMSGDPLRHFKRDEASIYNRALSGAEIASIFNAGAAGKRP